MATLTRIDLRVDEEKKTVIARAAELANMTITQYVLSLVWPDAERRVSEQSRIRLSANDWDAFVARLDAPTRDLPELRELLSRPSRFRDA
jgi:uncharacterized protein (DUF1778 family)